MDSFSQSKVTLLPNDTVVAHLFEDDLSPKALRDWTLSDIPVISLHITSFADSTCVGFKMPHCVTDGGGARIMIYGLTQVLAGKLPPTLPVRGNKGPDSPLIDPYVAAAKGYNGEGAAVAKYCMSGFTLFFFFFHLLLDIIWNRREKKRLIHLPKDRVQAIYAEAMQGLPEGTWVSSSDAVVAWLVKIALPHSRYPHGVTFSHIFDARGRSKAFPALTFNNALLRTFAWIDNSVESSIIKDGALAIRRAVQSQTSEDELGKQAAFGVAKGNTMMFFYRVGRSQLFFGDSGASMKGHEIDWSAARKGIQATGDAHAFLSPRWIWPIINVNGWPQRYTTLMNRDREGAFWIQLNMREKDRVIIEKVLAGQAILVE